MTRPRPVGQVERILAALEEIEGDLPQSVGITVRLGPLLASCLLPFRGDVGAGLVHCFHLLAGDPRRLAKLLEMATQLGEPPVVDHDRGRRKLTHDKALHRRSQQAFESRRIGRFENGAMGGETWHFGHRRLGL